MLTTSPTTGPQVCAFVHHFTGKERDTESGNDYFGARYFGSSMGRFMSPDWSDDPDPIPFGDLENPQSFKLYAFAGNNPLSALDEDGHDYYLQGGSQCGQNSVSCGANGYVLGSDGNRQVVTDAQTQNGGAIPSQGANGGVNVTIGTGTFAGEFFDASPGAVSMVVNSDESLAPSAQAFANDVGGYANAAMPLINAQLDLTVDLAGFALRVPHLAVTLLAARSKGQASQASSVGFGGSLGRLANMEVRRRRTKSQRQSPKKQERKEASCTGCSKRGHKTQDEL